MVDFINKRIGDGEDPFVAAREGAVARLRPILTTTLTTCFGLWPLAIGLGGQDLILAPMAISIAAGLGISTGLVLLVVPAVHAILVGDLGAGRADPEFEREVDLELYELRLEAEQEARERLEHALRDARGGTESEVTPPQAELAAGTDPKPSG